jgi:hypothetical protein
MVVGGADRTLSQHDFRRGNGWPAKRINVKAHNHARQNIHALPVDNVWTIGNRTSIAYRLNN